jgi:hypothetical protein
VEDGKLLFAYHEAQSKPMRPVQDYFWEALAAIRKKSQSYGKSKRAQSGEATRYGFGPGSVWAD